MSISLIFGIDVEAMAVQRNLQDILTQIMLKSLFQLECLSECQNNRLSLLGYLVWKLFTEWDNNTLLTIPYMPDFPDCCISCLGCRS